MDDGELLTFLQARAASYLGQPQHGRLSVELGPRDVRAKSTLVPIGVRLGTQETRLLVKLTPQVLGAEMSAARPRLGLPPERWPARPRLEFEALRRTQTHLAESDDPRVGWLPVLEMLPREAGTVMSYVDAPTLRTVLARAAVLPGRGRGAAASLAAAGAWLRAFHTMPLPGADAVRAEPSSVVAAFGEYAAHLARAGTDTVLVRRAEREGAELAERAWQQGEVQLGPAHTDPAPRNFFVLPGRRVAGFDMLADWLAPTCEDLAYLLLSLGGRGWRGLAHGPAARRRMRRAALTGYAGSQAAALAESPGLGWALLLVSLDRWAAELQRRPTAGGPPRDLRSAEVAAVLAGRIL